MAVKIGFCLGRAKKSRVGNTNESSRIHGKGWPYEVFEEESLVEKSVIESCGVGKKVREIRDDKRALVSESAGSKVGRMGFRVLPVYVSVVTAGFLHVCS